MEQGFDGEEPMDDPEAEERYRQELLAEARAYAPGQVVDEPLGKVADGYDIPPVHDKALEAVTAFLVVCMPDGSKPAYSNVNTPLVLQREANLNDMFEGAAQVQRDATIMMMTSQVVGNTINGMMQVMQQQMQSMADQQLAAQAGVDPTGAVLLNRAQRRQAR